MSLKIVSEISFHTYLSLATFKDPKFYCIAVHTSLTNEFWLDIKLGLAEFPESIKQTRWHKMEGLCGFCESGRQPTCRSNTLEKRRCFAPLSWACSSALAPPLAREQETHLWSLSVFSNPLAWAPTVHQIETHVVLLSPFELWTATITQGNNARA